MTQLRADLYALRTEAATSREEAARRTGPLRGDGASVVQDAAGSMPRVELTAAQVEAIQQAGPAPTVGAAPTDPRAYPASRRNCSKRRATGTGWRTSS